MNFHCPAEIHLCNRNGQVVAVSYTHLDVYKRQNIPSTTTATDMIISGTVISALGSSFFRVA